MAISKKAKGVSVLIVSTLAFTVCFMVWMMFGVIGIPIKKTLDLNATAVRHPHRDAGAHRLADPRAAGHVDRQVRRPHRDVRADDGLRGPDLADRLRDRVLAVPGARALRRRRRRLVLGRHALRRALVRPQAPGLRDGRLRRRQLRRRRQQVRRARADRRLRLGGGAAGLRGGDARHRDPVLVVAATAIRSTWSTRRSPGASSSWR